MRVKVKHRENSNYITTNWQLLVLTDLSAVFSYQYKRKRIFTKVLFGNSRERKRCNMPKNFYSSCEGGNSTAIYNHQPVDITHKIDINNTAILDTRTTISACKLSKHPKAFQPYKGTHKKEQMGTMTVT